MISQQQAQSLIALAVAIKAAHDLQIDVLPRCGGVAVLVSGRVVTDCRHAREHKAIMNLVDL